MKRETLSRALLKFNMPVLPAWLARVRSLLPSSEKEEERQSPPPVIEAETA